MTKKLLLVVFLLLVCICSVMAQDDIYAGKIYKTFQADLDGNGNNEIIDVKVEYMGESGWFAKVIVRTNSGEIIWKSPAFKKYSFESADPFLFGSWDWGSSIPEIITDVNGDQKAEMLVPDPVSDVRPVTYRIFSWSNNKFKYLYSKKLMEQTKNSGKYVWVSPNTEFGRWIGVFEETLNNNTFKVNIWDMESYEAGVKYGSAIVSPTSNGFVIIKWTEPLK